MEQKPQETKKDKNPTSHSNFRKGMSDYNDGGLNATHHLGNEHYDGASLTDENSEEAPNEKLEGKVAEGNDLTPEADED